MQYVTGQLFHESRREWFFSLQRVADFCGVSASTVSKWESGRAPRWALDLMRFYAGYISFSGWERWRFVASVEAKTAGIERCLYSEFDDRTFSPGEINATFFVKQLVRTLETDNRLLGERAAQLTEEIDALTNPAPTNVVLFPLDRVRRPAS